MLRTKRSVTILGTALPMNEPRRSIQWPGREGSHALATGTHWKMQTQQMAIHHITVMVKTIVDTILKLRVKKSRQYILRMLPLTIMMVVTYTHSNDTCSCVVVSGLSFSSRGFGERGVVGMAYLEYEDLVRQRDQRGVLSHAIAGHSTKDCQCHRIAQQSGPEQVVVKPKAEPRLRTRHTTQAHEDDR